MEPMLKQMGLEGDKGKSIVYGVFSADVDESKIPSSEERAQLRQQAAVDLVNIDMMERERRDQVGTFATYASIAYIIWVSLFADDGGFVGHILRFFAVVPIALAYGYKTSAKMGL